MIDVKVPADALKAAMLFQGKRDIRYYLNGVHINKDGFIESTNGHMAIRCGAGDLSSLSDSILVSIQGTIPAKAETAHLRAHDDEGAGLVGFYDCDNNPVKDANGFQIHRAFTLVSYEKYPDIGSLIKDERESMEKISFRSEYMKAVTDAAKILGDKWGGVTAEFGGKGKAVYMRPMNRDDVHIILMPMRD